MNKYDTDKWLLYVNQTYDEPLGSITYTYYATAKDDTGNENLTETRYLNVNAIYPGINFTSPTPDNGTITTNTSIEINVSITNADDLDEVIYNWDGTNYTCGIKSYFGIGDYSCTDYDNDSLVLAMNFDNVSALGENNTYVVDLSGNGNNGTTSGNPVMNLTGGKYGGAFEFDGSWEYIQTLDESITDNIGTDDFTVAFWMKSYSTAVYQNFIISTATSNVNSYGFMVAMGNTQSWNDGKLLFFTQDAGGTTGIQYFSDTNYNDGEWYYVVVRREGTNLTGWVNSVNLNSNNGTIRNVSAGSTLKLGTRSTVGGGSGFFNGTIDEVRIWNKSLSADEIYQQYVSNSKAPPYLSNLNKYDTDKWLLYVNQTYDEPLASATHTYFASAKDTTGNENSTETRYLNVNAIIPGINFTAPTPDNGANTTNTSIEINVSITNASDLSGVKFNWDSTNYTIFNDSLVLI